MGVERPTSSDREQQRKDNVESRRQSGLEPLPRDRGEEDEGRRAGTRDAEPERAQEEDEESDRSRGS